MTGKQYLSAYQQGIVRRFYAHRDTALRQKLAELVSELYLCESEKQSARLWKSARDTMLKSGADESDVEQIVSGHKIEDLARIVTELNAAPSAGPRTTPRRPADDDL